MSSSISVTVKRGCEPATSRRVHALDFIMLERFATPELVARAETGGVSNEPRGPLEAGAMVERCCGEDLRFFWAEDGRRLAICRHCGQKVVDSKQIRDSQSPWIGVDLDGTLARETASTEPDFIGAPIEPMATRVKEWVAQGKTVKIFTARASNSRQVANVSAWLKRHDFPDLEVTNVKDFRMIELWDDRCVRVATNQGEPVVELPESTIRRGKNRAIGSQANFGRRKPASFFSTLRYLLAL